jgi:hypothetical protein
LIKQDNKDWILLARTVVNDPGEWLGQERHSGQRCFSSLAGLGVFLLVQMHSDTYSLRVRTARTCRRPAPGERAAG